MDCEQVSSLSPVTFVMWCGGGGGRAGGGAGGMVIADEMRSGFPDKNINYRPWRGEEPKSEDFSSPTDPETLESSCLIRDTIPAAGSCSRPRPSPQGHASWTMGPQMGPLYQGHAAVHLGHAFFVWATPIHQGHASFHM